MKYLQILLAVVALSGFVGVHATPPIEYNAAVRNSDGYVMAKMPVKFMLEIVDKASGGNVLYSEVQTLTTDDQGYARMMVGEGSGVNGDYDAIDWSAPRFLSVKADVDGSGNYRSMGTMQLLGAPIARQAKVANRLTVTKPNGTVNELTVNNDGELRWTVTEENTGTPNYDQSKVPDRLYYIGNFNNWNVAEAVEMTKLSSTKFTIDRHLTRGEVFKFVPEQSWNGYMDWSGTAIEIGEPVSMQERGDTPAFNGQEGDYTITVDFYNFTMLITKK